MHRPTPRWRLVRCALLIAGGLFAGGAVYAQDEAAEPAPAELEFPPGLQVDWLGTLTQGEDGSAEFTGPVTITWRDTRIQADRLSLREKRYVEAEGNVLIVWGRNRIFGQRMSYDLEEETGVFEDAMGQTLDEYLFWAKSIEKIGEKKVRINSGTVTTCTQPVPYWSFRVSSAIIVIDNYARMRNVRLKATKVPVFYLPYMVWPVKEGRAAGLLLPEFATSQTLGQSYSQDLFIPIGRSADLTLEARFYTEAGIGGGASGRFIPNENGRGLFGGFYIDDQVFGAERYQVNYQQEQRFRNGFRMIADVAWVSDAQYYSDYERDLNVASSPQTLARLEFSKNGPIAGLNVRELQREQLSSGLVQRTLPEIEWRGRNRRLGRSPLYLSFEASIASIQQRRDTLPGQPSYRPDYLRGDVFPVLTLPASPVPWLDITPRVSYRMTYYTQRQTLDGRMVVDDNLSRGLLQYGVQLTGPKLFRIYEPKKGEKGQRYKHTMETQVTYGFAESFDLLESREVLLFDEVDRFNGSGTQLNYAFVQRLFARRPRSSTPLQMGDLTPVQLPDGSVSTAGVRTALPAIAGAGADSGPPTSEPVEVASLEIRQTRSYDEPISSGIVGTQPDPGDPTQTLPVVDTSPYSPVLISGRYNPGPNLSLDLRSNFDVIFNQFSGVSLSGSLRAQLVRLRFSMIFNNGLGVNGLGQKIEDDTQMRATAAFNLLQGRLGLRVDGSFSGNPPPGTSNFPEQRWQLEYTTQCCTFFVERLTREFTGAEDRRELSFRVDLRGVGKILSSTF